MATIIVSTFVSAPIESVFNIYTDLENIAERVSAITKLEILTEGPFGKGTRWRETRVVMKKAATEEMTVTSLDPPNGYTVESRSHGMLYETHFTFKPESDGTRVTWGFNGTPQTFGARLSAPIFALFFNGMMKKCMLSDLEELRDVCVPD